MAHYNCGKIQFKKRICGKTVIQNTWSLMSGSERECECDILKFSSSLFESGNNVDSIRCPFTFTSKTQTCRFAKR